MIKNYGYIPDPVACEKLAMASESVYGRGDDLPRDMDRSSFPYRLLAFALKKNPRLVRGDELLTRNQGSHGSCVGHGTARMAATNLAADILVRELPHEWPADESGQVVDVSPSWLYGASRQVPGQLGSWEGSNGSWAVRALCDYGMLFELDYGVVDLTSYRAIDCNEWEARGVPADSIALAGAHKFRARALVEDIEQWVGLVQNYYAATVCSSLGFRKTRDEWGRSVPSGRWAHCMVGGMGYFAKQIKPQTWLRMILIQNSWYANWISGPLNPHCPDQPEGSFWVDLDVAERMLGYGDTWITSGGNALLPAPRNWRNGAFDV